MNVKEMSLGGWATAVLILVAMCSLGNEPFSAGPFVGVISVLMGFCCLIRAMVLCSTPEKKNIDWKAFRDFVIGAGISAIIPAVLFSIAA